MRLILHIGMPKAGSTALQTAFAGARGALRKAGILYPRGASNHSFLVAGIVPPEQAGRVLTQHYEGNTDTVGADFAAFWQKIVDAIAEERPSRVVMSAEYLFNGLGRAGPEPLRALLAPLGAETEIVCYVRRPSDQYLSVAQQQLKASWAIRPPRPITYRRQLEAASAAVDRLHVVAYDRARFPDGDIVADFAARFLPDVESVLRAHSVHDRNASMSAEAMAVLQEYRRERHPDANDRFTHDTTLLRRRLAEREAELGGRRPPQLLPHVRESVDQSSVDVLWLRDAYGIVFDGIDYAAVGTRSAIEVESVTDICVVDPARRAALAEVAATLAQNAPVKEGKKRFRIAFSRGRP